MYTWSKVPPLCYLRVEGTRVPSVIGCTVAAAQWCLHCGGTLIPVQIDGFREAAVCAQWGLLVIVEGRWHAILNDVSRSGSSHVRVWVPLAAAVEVNAKLPSSTNVVFLLGLLIDRPISSAATTPCSTCDLVRIFPGKSFTSGLCQSYVFGSVTLPTVYFGLVVFIVLCVHLATFFTHTVVLHINIIHDFLWGNGINFLWVWTRCGCQKRLDTLSVVYSWG